MLSFMTTLALDTRWFGGLRQIEHSPHLRPILTLLTTLWMAKVLNQAKTLRRSGEPLPNRIKHFLWILYHKRAKNNQRLHSLGMLNTPNCSICGCHNEDASHLFFKCYIAKQFWQKVLHSQRIKYKFDGSTVDSSNWMEYWSKISGKPCSSILNWETIFP